MIDFELTDEQKQLQETARRFAEKEIRPVAAEVDGESGAVAVDGYAEAVLAVVPPRLTRDEGVELEDAREGRAEALRLARCGDVTILPLWPRAGEQARRVIIRARKGVASPARLLPGLVLHDAEGHFTPEAERILRDGAALPLKGSTSAADSAS